MLVAVLGVGCGRQPRSVVRTEMHMGTLVSVRIDGLDYAAAQPHLDAAFAAIRAVDERFSNYKPDSELSRLNAAAAEAPQPVSPEMAALLQRARHWGARSGGAFDCTVGPLMRAWGFFQREGRIPAPEELADARALTGWAHVTFDAEARTVAFDAAGVELDFGAIAKGLAVDDAIAALRARGVEHALVDASGNFAALGTPADRPVWRIGIRHPLRKDAIIADLEFQAGEGIATSGGYENYFEVDGTRYVHIIDPRTGRPVEGMLSTSVIAPNATDADALSTATFVLGVDRSLELIRGEPHTECLLVSGSPNDPASLEVHMTDGMRARTHLHLDEGP